MRVSWSDESYTCISMPMRRGGPSLTVFMADFERWSNLSDCGKRVICVREAKNMAQLDTSLLNGIDYQHPYSDDYIKKHARFMRFYKWLPDFWVDVFGLGFGRRYQIVHGSDYYLRVDGVSWVR